ncbi:hypothetical protein RUND412_005821 [Rhizina undulata]
MNPIKKKYFRLLPHHEAPTTSFYTAGSVQKQVREDQLKKDHEDEKSRHLKRKRTSPFNNPYIATTLGRELAIVPDPQLYEASRRVYAYALEHRKVFDIGFNGNISAFDTYTASNSEKYILLGTTAGRVACVPATVNDDGVLECDLARGKALTHLPSQVTAVNVSRGRMLLASCLGGNVGPSVYLTRLPDPDSDETHIPGQSLAFGQQIRSIWTSVPSPFNGNMLLGTTMGVVWLEEHPYDWNIHVFSTGSDAFAVEFSQSNPHFFFCGARDGGMRLSDIRLRTARQNEDPRAEIVVRHGSAITHLRHINEMMVLVNGLQGCAMYDLRYPHPASPSAEFARPTRPAIQYEKVTRHAKGEMVGLGFDLNRDRKVIAVTNQDNFVKLFSTETGDALDSPVSREKLANVSRCVRFDVQDRSESLFVANGPRLELYAS